MPSAPKIPSSGPRIPEPSGENTSCSPVSTSIAVTWEKNTWVTYNRPSGPTVIPLAPPSRLGGTTVSNVQPWATVGVRSVYADQRSVLITSSSAPVAAADEPGATTRASGLQVEDGVGEPGQLGRPVGWRGDRADDELGEAGVDPPSDQRTQRVDAGGGHVRRVAAAHR